MDMMDIMDIDLKWMKNEIQWRKKWVEKKLWGGNVDDYDLD